MNLTFEVSVIGAISLIAGCGWWIISKIFELKSKIRDLATRAELLEQKQKADHMAIVETTDAKEKAIWSQFQSMNASLMQIVQQLGRVEGKIDSKH